MKVKSLDQLRKQLEDQLNTYHYQDNYITGDEFEKWLKDKKKDSVKEINSNNNNK